jgi:hypothetical protein
VSKPCESALASASAQGGTSACAHERAGGSRAFQKPRKQASSRRTYKIRRPVSEPRELGSVPLSCWYCRFLCPTRRKRGGDGANNASGALVKARHPPTSETPKRAWSSRGTTASQVVTHNNPVHACRLHVHSGRPVHESESHAPLTKTIIHGLSSERHPGGRDSQQPHRIVMVVVEQLLLQRRCCATRAAGPAKESQTRHARCCCHSQRARRGRRAVCGLDVRF